MCDVLLGLYEEARTGLRMVEAHICRPGQPPETRAELRGRELAYRTIVSQLRTAIAQHDRMGAPSDIEGALANIQAARRLIEGVKPAGYKSEYCKGFALDSLQATERAVIGLWNVINE